MSDKERPPPRAPRNPASASVDPAQEQIRSQAQRLIGWLAGAAEGRLRAWYGAIFLGIGGLVLTVGWHAGPQKYLEAREFQTLHARAPARIVESWIAVEFDPAQMGKYPYWRPFAKASPCVVVEYTTDWTGPARRAFCGTRLTFFEHYMLHDVREVTAGVPFYWARDERGFIVPEIRVSAAAKKYLETHGPTSAFTPADLQSGTELSWLRYAYDRPDDNAVAGWVQPEPALQIAVDPARPGDAWPVGFIEDQGRRKPDWITGVIGLLIGSVAWFIGWQLVLGERSPVLVGVFAIGLLLGLPWWGDALPRMLRSMNADFGEVIADMLGDVDAVDRLVASAPEDAMLAQGERIAWRTGDDAYADTFGKIAFKLPDPRPTDPDAALNALADVVAAKMRALDESERRKMFERLAQNKINGRSKAGFVFLRAAREAYVDAHAAPEVRDSARRFLEAWVTQPVEDPYPGDLGFETRIRLLRELTTIPQPNYIAIPASWIVERAEGRRIKTP